MENSDKPKSTSLVCYICNERFRRPHLLPCLHVFCMVCLQDECQGNSQDKFYCPLCVTAKEKDKKSVHARPWHGFESIIEKETEDEELQNRLAELPGFDDKVSWDNMEESDDSSAGSGRSNSATRNNEHTTNTSNALEPPLSFPCTMHADRLADTFCFKCQQLACHKCVSSFHRRCQQFSDLRAAVETKRAEFDQIHSKMASNLVACNEVRDYQSERINGLEEMRTRVLINIKTFRTELVNMILAKEKALTTQANRLIDQMKINATTKMNAASKMSESLDKQMELLDLSISVKGEGELLPLLSGIMSGIENDAELIGAQYGDETKEVLFSRDEQCKETIQNSLLGEVNLASSENEGDRNSNENGLRRDLNLTLLTSFHGGTRDDVTEPLLTDLILLANGDIILTDRDNKCVKKFNQSGKLLTRVIIDAVPSRIASVSHGRAVVSVMTKKCLYFLSLFGTVRILNSVPVKKIYSFLTSIGNGLLIAGTNQCDSIDLISERGETIRKILTQKPDRATIARPLYLTPVVPHSMISLKLDHKNADNHKTQKPNGSLAHQENTENNNTNNKTLKEITGSASSSSMPLIKNTISSKPLPQITKNGKNGGLQTNSLTSSTTNSASKSHKRRTSLPATQSVSSPAQNPVLSSSTSSLSASNTNISSTSSTSSSDKIALLVSDSGKRILYRMEQDGSTAFTLKSNDNVTLECPLGVTVHESGLTLLSDRDTDSVVLLDESGSVLKRILTSKDGVSKPCGIYAGNKGIVALSQVDGMVKVYKPSK